MSEELELKYSIEKPRAVRRWLDSTFPAADGQRWRTHAITDRYFDTADGALAAAGYGARLRRNGRRTTLTLKSDIEVTGALHRRDELEAQATQDLDASRWPPSAARERLVGIAGERRLVERFAVRQTRRERQLTVARTTFMASIDSGAVYAAGAEVGRIAQLEFERLRGRRSALARVERAAQSSDLAVPEPRSKLALAAEMSAAAARVRADDSFVEAGRKVLRRHLLRMLERETATRAGDPLALKQMRVATRRMRATWRVFGDAFRKQPRQRFAADLRTIGRALGTVRDVDVLLASVADESPLEPLADHWRARRAAAFGELLEVIGSKRYARFVARSLDLTSTVGAGADHRHAERSVAETAPAALRAAFDRLAESRAATAGTDDVTTWHALRIESRRFRYSVEAFDDVLEKGAAAELLRRVIRVQDHLGAMNDAAVAIEKASRWQTETGQTLDEATASAIGRYVSAREAKIAALRKSFGAASRGLGGTTFERLLERASRAPSDGQR